MYCDLITLKGFWDTLFICLKLELKQAAAFSGWPTFAGFCMARWGRLTFVELTL